MSVNTKYRIYTYTGITCFWATETSTRSTRSSLTHTHTHTHAHPCTPSTSGQRVRMSCLYGCPSFLPRCCHLQSQVLPVAGALYVSLRYMLDTGTATCTHVSNRYVEHRCLAQICNLFLSPIPSTAICFGCRRARSN